MKTLVMLILLVFALSAYSQVAINENGSPADSSAMLDVNSANKGVLIPRMTQTQRDSIANPAPGLLIFQTDNSPGFYFNNGTVANPNWTLLGKGAAWNLTGDSGTVPGTNFIGTTDNQALIFKVNNTLAGNIQPSNGSLAFGLGAGQNFSSCNYCSSFGTSALALNYGDNNSAFGWGAMASNNSGFYDVAYGGGAMYTNSSGYKNTALGYQSLYFNSSGYQNTAVGYNAMVNNTIGISNTAVGMYAMHGNNGSLGSYNTAVGADCLTGTTNSEYNTAIGFNAASAHDMGYNNTIVGANCDITANGLYNDVAIGQAVTCTASSQARIGNSATNSIGGYANWTNLSDGRYKTNIKENVPGLAFIMKLRPVTYHLDVDNLSKKLNEDHGNNMNTDMRNAMTEKENLVFTGFVAQDVEKAAEDCGYNFSGVDKPKNENDFYGLRYAEFVVPLVKAVQELELQNQELTRQNESLQKRIEKLENK